MTSRWLAAAAAAAAAAEPAGARVTSLLLAAVRWRDT